VLSLSDDDARGRLAVAGQQRENVVSAAVTGLDDEREVGGQAAVVGVARLVLVLSHTPQHSRQPLPQPTT
jgi:hypothetical protein